MPSRRSERAAAAGAGGGTTATAERPADRRAPRSAPVPAETGHVLIISGLSGAGKSQASKLFEDLGYYCVDNLPPSLLDGFLELREADPGRYGCVALVLDIRAGDPADAIEHARVRLAERNVPCDVVFLEASDAVLVSRFSETRHRHPLQASRGVQAGIVEERRRLHRTREMADHVIDTSGLSIGQLKERLFGVLPQQPGTEVVVQILTFAFKRGIPLEADLVFDVRFLTNPYWEPRLKPHSGLHADVRAFVLAQPAADRFLTLLTELLELTLPAYRAEGKSRVTVAIGCTGGYHRSIVLAEELAERLRREGRESVTVFHRELER